MADDTFDPRQHLTQIQGRTPYLEVKWRLVWLRTEHPDAVIDTQLMDHSDRHAIFRAEIILPTGGRATGWGSETAGDFGDFIEKAETKAIGRALNALGYGLPELDPDGARGPAGRPVDQRDRRAQAGADLERRQGAQGASAQQPAAPDRATRRQLEYLRAVARELDVDPDVVAQERYGAPAAELSRRDASDFIQWLQR